MSRGDSSHAIRVCVLSTAAGFWTLWNIPFYNMILSLESPASHAIETSRGYNYFDVKLYFTQIFWGKHFFVEESSKSAAAWGERQASLKHLKQITCDFKTVLWDVNPQKHSGCKNVSDPPCFIARLYFVDSKFWGRKPMWKIYLVWILLKLDESCSGDVQDVSIQLCQGPSLSSIINIYSRIAC